MKRRHFCLRGMSSTFLTSAIVHIALNNLKKGKRVIIIGNDEHYSIFEEIDRQSFCKASSFEIEDKKGLLKSINFNSPLKFWTSSILNNQDILNIVAEENIRDTLVLVWVKVKTLESFFENESLLSQRTQIIAIEDETDSSILPIQNEKVDLCLFQQAGY